ncbi:MAG: ester cyclase [Saprospiraceae bacterium]|nr:ester cyclase [Saprospiraceae bacterium]
MIEKHKEIARLISQKVVNEKDYTPIEEYLTEDYVYHGIGGMMSKTPKGFMEAIKGFHAAIPDLKSEIIDMVGEGDRLVLRFNFTGTHKGEFLGFPSSGAKLHFEGMIMRRFEGEKLPKTGIILISQQLFHKFKIL